MRDEGKIIHVELIRRNFHVRKRLEKLLKPTVIRHAHQSRPDASKVSSQILEKNRTL